MDRDRLLELLDGYLEQRLSAADAAALNAALRGDPSARRLFWECAHQHALLADLLAEARGQQLAQEEAVRLATPATGVPASPWRRTAASPALLAMVLALLLAVGMGWLFRFTPEEVEAPLPGTYARLGTLRGDVLVIDETARQPARTGQVVRPGEEIRTGEDGFAVVTYPDQSRLEINADTAVRLLEDADRPGTSGKRIFLVEGVLNAMVAPQPQGRPMLLSTLQADLLAPGNRFSSASVMGETRIEMEQGKALLSRKGDDRPIEIQDGSYAVASPDLEVFRSAPMLPSRRDPAAIFEEPSGPVLGLAPVDQGRALAIACSNGLVKLWDVKSRRVRTTLDAGRTRTLAVAATADGRTLAAGYESPPKKGPEPVPESVLVWDVRRRAVQRILAGTRKVHTLSFTPDSRTLVFASPARPGVWVWDLPEPRTRHLDAGRERFVLGERHDRVRSIALSPDGKTVVAGCIDGRVRRWDLHTGRPLATFEGHTHDVQALCFQPGGQLIASGSRDGSIRLWSPATGEEVRKLTGKFGEVRCLAFSPDGQTLVSGHAGIAILWNIATGQQRTTLKAHKFAITALVYLNDGRTLATAGWDRTVKLWDLQPVAGNPL